MGRLFGRGSRRGDCVDGRLLFFFLEMKLFSSLVKVIFYKVSAAKYNCYCLLGVAGLLVFNAGLAWMKTSKVIKVDCVIVPSFLL